MDRESAHPTGTRESLPDREHEQSEEYARANTDKHRTQSGHRPYLQLVVVKEERRNPPTGQPRFKYHKLEPQDLYR